MRDFSLAVQIASPPFFFLFSTVRINKNILVVWAKKRFWMLRSWRKLRFLTRAMQVVAKAPTIAPKSKL
jgi:hypothetical protein